MPLRSLLKTLRPLREKREVSRKGHEGGCAKVAEDDVDRNVSASSAKNFAFSARKNRSFTQMLRRIIQGLFEALKVK